MRTWGEVRISVIKGLLKRNKSGDPQDVLDEEMVLQITEELESLEAEQEDYYEGKENE